MGGYNCSGWSFEEPGNDAFGHLHTITLLRFSFSCRFLFFLLVFFPFRHWDWLYRKKHIADWSALGVGGFP